MAAVGKDAAAFAGKFASFRSARELYKDCMRLCECASIFYAQKHVVFKLDPYHAIMTCICLNFHHDQPFNSCFQSFCYRAGVFIHRHVGGNSPKGLNLKRAVRAEFTKNRLLTDPAVIEEKKLGAFRFLTNFLLIESNKYVVDSKTKILISNEIGSVQLK